MSKHELQAELSEEEFGKLVEVHLKGRKREIEMLGGLIGTMIHSWRERWLLDALGSHNKDVFESTHFNLATNVLPKIISFLL